MDSTGYKKFVLDCLCWNNVRVSSQIWLPLHDDTHILQSWLGAMDYNLTPKSESEPRRRFRPERRLNRGITLACLSTTTACLPSRLCSMSYSLCALVTSACNTLLNDASSRADILQWNILIIYQRLQFGKRIGFPITAALFSVIPRKHTAAPSYLHGSAAYYCTLSWVNSLRLSPHWRLTWLMLQHKETSFSRIQTKKTFEL